MGFMLNTNTLTEQYPLQNIYNFNHEPHKGFTLSRYPVPNQNP